MRSSVLGYVSRSVSVTSTKYVYFFDEGDGSMTDLLGGKGAGLAEMTRAGLPVPQGFIITTAGVPAISTRPAARFPNGLDAQVEAVDARARSANAANASATPPNPLLVSVRSGARVSMPGMMDTILNLGLNDRTVAGLAKLTEQRALRLGRVSALHHDVLERRARHRKRALRGADRGAKTARSASRTIPQSTPTRGSALVDAFKAVVRSKAGREFPQDVPSSCALRSAPSSIRGTPSARSTIAASTRFPTTGARRSASSRWSSATWATIRARALPSRAIPIPASTCSSASI